MAEGLQGSVGTTDAGKSKAKTKNEELAMPSGLRAPNVTDNAHEVLKRRYFKKDKEGNVVEDIKGLFWRVASNLALGDRRIDKNADVEKTALKFYDLISSLDFLPNSPTLMNAGRELQQLAACFVLPVEDSMESIFETVKHTALIHKSGGGTGFSFSRLRPSGAMVGSTSGVSSGPVSFMTVFDAATEAIKQGGTRRGANMGMLRIDHPDIMSFITCKEDMTKLNNFNISVLFTEDFMESVKKEEDYDLINPGDKRPVGKLNAKEVYDKIVNNAWSNGEPGIVFIDRVNKDNPTPHIGEMEATNPCGEQPLLPYESCNLGSINLNNMLTTTNDGQVAIDWDKLESTVRKAVHFLDNVIEMNKYPVQQIEDMTKANRKIGLGVMGFADLLIRLGIKYNSEAGVGMAEKVMEFINTKGRDESINLAKERGVFANFKGSMYDDRNQKVRNATVTTIAPTGTISIIGSASSGVEPLFAVAFTRNVMDGTELIEVNPVFEEIAKNRGFYSKELIERIAKEGSIHEIDEIPQDVKDVFVTAHDVSPTWHIKMQAAFQRHTDNAVSKTVNFCKDATRQDVEEVYNLAYESGLKGVTVYRDGSRDGQVLTVGSEKAKLAEAQEAIDEALAGVSKGPKARGDVAFGITRKVMTGCGNLYVTINEDEDGKPMEIFTQVGKAGGCISSQCEAIGRMTSLSLRSGIELREITTQMRGIRCHLPVGFGPNQVSSCSDGVAQAMEWYIGYKQSVGQPISMQHNENELAFTLASNTEATRGACPDCGGTVEHADGCVVCRSCGYSECG